jgi:tetratricopeptide (TPR) repeat protein
MTAQEAIKQAQQHEAAGRLDSAERLYLQALAASPNHAEALYSLGVLAWRAGNSQAAVSFLERAIAANPSEPEIHDALGRAYATQGRLDDAIAAYRKALALQPGFAMAHNDLGMTLTSKGELDDAIGELQTAAKLQPQSPEVQYNLGNALKRKGQLGPATWAYRKALELRPGFPEACVNLGNILQELRQFEEVLALGRLALEARPNFPEAHNNVGIALRELNRPHESLRAFQEALKLRPNYAEAHNNLGNAHKDLGQLAPAIESYRRALALQPDYALAHWNLGMALLSHGDFAEGWSEYEWRFRAKAAHEPPRQFEQPRWDGSDLNGRRILVYAEQGLGDTIQMVRYLPLVAERGGKIILECQPALIRLLRDFPGIDALVAAGQALPAFDVHCPLLSLPMLFRTDMDSIPAGAPYLHADAALAAAWRARLDSAGAALKVGVAWAGNPKHRNDRNRSMPISALAPLAGVADLFFISLQKGPVGAQAADPAPGITLADFTAELHDWVDTAALIANLDLVICVDTAIAHLAGAMGRPTWILQPVSVDWRWLLDRADSPWYPSVRLFRQSSPGDWKTPMNEIVEALRALPRPRK